MKNNKKKSIGILGGMGPDASTKLYQLMIEKSRTDFNSTNNEDYPNVILHSLPVPDFISSKERSLEALSMLQESTKHLSEKCMVMGIACNTAHLFIEELRAISKSPFVSIIDEVGKKISDSRYKKVGLLATPTTIRSRLYQNTLGRMGIEVIVPEKKQIEELGSIVCKIVEGNYEHTIKTVKNIADSLCTRGIDVIVLGCTELSLVFPKKYQLPVVSSLEILADSLLRYYYKYSG